MNTVAQIKSIVENIVVEGMKLHGDSDSVNAIDSNSISELNRNYVSWYTKARKLIQT